MEVRIRLQKAGETRLAEGRRPGPEGFAWYVGSDSMPLAERPAGVARLR